MYICHQVWYPLFLLDFNITCIFSIYFRKILKYQFLWKSFQWRPSCSLRSDKRTDRHGEYNSHFPKFKISKLCLLIYFFTTRISMLPSVWFWHLTSFFKNVSRQVFWSLHSLLQFFRNVKFDFYLLCVIKLLYQDDHCFWQRLALLLIFEQLGPSVFVFTLL